MICSNCNKEIEDGSTYCLECGAPIEEPVVIKDIKKKPVTDEKKSNSKVKSEARGPLFDFSGYVKSLGSNTSALLGLLGALLVYLSPFFTWLWQKSWANRYSANLFVLGGKNDDMSLNEKIFILMAVLIILSALDMLAFSACNYIGPLKSFDKMYIVKILPIVLSIIFFVIVLNNESFKLAEAGIESQIQSAKNFGVENSVDGGKGVGPIMLIVGNVIYAISIVLDVVKREK